MRHVTSLIGAPGQHLVTNALLQEAWQALTSLGAEADHPTILSEGDAAEIVFDGIAPGAARQSLIEMMHTRAIDVAVTHQHDRRKMLLVADMDSTIITVECIDELADLAGVGEEVAAVTEQAMRGDLNFEEALRHRVSLLEGLAQPDLQKVLDERIQLTSGARTLVQTMKSHGATTCLVSGGFTFFTGAIAERCGFDHHRGNQLETSAGTLTGRVVEPILGQKAKIDTLIEFRQGRELLAHETIAVGDGANDLAMLTEAGIGVAFRAKPVVAESADVSIVHGDLTALLFLQGYHRSEFID